MIRIRRDKSHPYCWLYTAPCVKNSFTTIFSASFPRAGQPQGTSRLQNRLRGTTQPSQGSQELQLSLCSGGKGWSYCIRNSAAAWATEILTCCINLCASWISYILLLSAICFSDFDIGGFSSAAKMHLALKKIFPVLVPSLWLTETVRDQTAKGNCDHVLLQLLNSRKADADSYCLEEMQAVKPPSAWSLCQKGACVRAWLMWSREGDLSLSDLDKNICLALGVAPLHPPSK